MYFTEYRIPARVYGGNNSHSKLINFMRLFLNSCLLKDVLVNSYLNYAKVHKFAEIMTELFLAEVRV